MSILVALLTLLLLAVVIALISAPLLRVRRVEPSESASLAELRVAREAKYRELRDLELDFRTGKLSRADYDATSAALQGEAVEILNRIEASEIDSLEQADQLEEGARAPATPAPSVPEDAPATPAPAVPED
jgi:hypothetical protein